MSEIKLFNVPFTRKSADRVYYKTAEERDADFSTLSAEIKPVTNFERTDDLIFQVDVTDYPFSTNNNYAIYQGYHCFIESAVEKDQNTTRLQLSLDVVTQYLNGDTLDAEKQTQIRRTHLNRFKNNGDGTYSYDFDNSELRVQEDMPIIPSIFSDFEKLVDNKDALDIKWLAVSRTRKRLTIGAEDKILVTRPDGTQFGLSQQFRTFYVPLISGTIRFSANANGADPSQSYLTTRLEDVMDGLSEVADLVDVKIVSHLSIQDETITVEKYTDGFWYCRYDEGQTILQQIVSGETNTWGIVGATHGVQRELKVVGDGSAISEHNPKIPLATIQAQNFEPKLFQYFSYRFSFLQEFADIAYDTLLNDDIKVELQKGIDYATDRLDFYLRSGLWEDQRNIATTLAVISDNTIATATSQWAEYTANKKIGSSTGYAYGQQVLQGGAQTLFNLGTGNTFGAGATGFGTITSLVDTYVQRRDLENAPDTIKAKGSNILNDVGTDVMQLTITRLKPTQNEIETIENHLYEFGYKVDKIKNIKDIIDTRENFNYIQTLNSDSVLKIGISGALNDELNELLNRGVRFYKSIAKMQSRPKINNETNLV